MQADELSEYIKKSAAIETIHLRNCGINDENFAKLAEALQDTESKIKVHL